MIARAWKRLLNIVYPLRCAACGKDLEALNGLHVCARCMGRIRYTPQPYCRSCGRPLQRSDALCAECGKMRWPFSWARSACVYEEPLKALITLFKYKKKAYLIKPLSHIMEKYLMEHPEIYRDIDAVTFVPMGQGHARAKEYNQSEVLAQRIADFVSLPCLRALKKVRKTKPQNALSREERLMNLRDAFSVRHRARVKDARVLLVDDVMTTGATLGECAKALRDAGAREVRCFTLARGAS